VITAGIVSSSHAAFTGLIVESRGNISGVDVYQVFATFDSEANALLSCFNHQVVSGTMENVVHNDAFSVAGGSWNPALTLLPDQIANDSFVTISGLTGGLATTNFDPNFGAGVGASIPVNAGWFNANPAGSIVVGDALRVMIMQVAISPNSPGYVGSLRVAYKLSVALSTPVLSLTTTYTIPAPGVATLLLAAGTLGSRRRAR
jgi:hypothetical protein